MNAEMGDVSTIQAMPKIASQPQMPGKAQGSFSLTDLRRNQPRQHLHFTRVASKTVSQYISLF